MPLKTSYFNMGVFRNNLKRYWLIPFFFTFFLLLLVLSLLNDFTFYSEDLNAAARRIFYSSDIMLLFLGIFPLMSGLAVFSYMHFPKNTAMIHSLPLKRGTLFFTNYISGLSFVIFPLLLNGIILFVAEAAIGVKRLDYALIWFGITLLMAFLLYSFAVFAGMFTGHMASHAIFYMIFNFLAVFLEYMVNLIFKDFMFGFVSSATRFDVLSPLTYMGRLSSGFQQEAGNIVVILSYFAAGLFFSASSYLLYKKRHMEVATDVISLKIVKPIFKYSVTLCSSALIGSILISIMNKNGSITAYILTYLLGGLIGYFVSEMLLKKTFRVIKSYKGFIAYSIVLVLLLSSIAFDFFGTERYVPDNNEIEAVFVSEYPDSTGRLALRPEDYNKDNHGHIFYNGSYTEAPLNLTPDYIKAIRQYPGITTSTEAIANLRLLHSYIIKNKGIYSRSFQNTYFNNSVTDKYKWCPIYLAYRMSNGKIVERQYQIYTDMNDEFSSLFRDYLSLPEIFENREPIINKTPDDIASIRLSYNSINEYKSFYIDDKAGFLNAYKQDLKEIDPLYNVIGNYSNPSFISLDIEMKLSSDNVGFSTRKGKQIGLDFKNTTDYLLKKGLLTENDLEYFKTQQKY